MRPATLLFATTLLALAGAPAFGQDKPGPAPDSLGKTLSDNMRQSLNDALNPQRPIERITLRTTIAPPVTAAVMAGAGPCVIPLLSARTGDTVPMPNAAQPRTSQLAFAPPTDHMPVVAGAPVCPTTVSVPAAPAPATASPAATSPAAP
jgi:hypothetical protein